MVLRLKTRESRSLPGLQNARETTAAPLRGIAEKDKVAAKTNRNLLDTHFGPAEHGPPPSGPFVLLD